MGIQADMAAQKSGIVRSQQTVVPPEPQKAPRSREQHDAPDATVHDVDMECSSSDANSGDDDETGRRRGRGTLTQAERRERRCATCHTNMPHCPAKPCAHSHHVVVPIRLLSNRLAAKRSYYRRQNRQTGIKQAIDQVQAELSNARSKVAMFKLVLREAGLDPEAILANANVPGAVAAAVNSVPTRAHQQVPLQRPQHPPAPALQLQQWTTVPPAGVLVSKQPGLHVCHVTPPNALTRDTAAVQMAFARSTCT